MSDLKAKNLETETIKRPEQDTALAETRNGNQVVVLRTENLSKFYLLKKKRIQALKSLVLQIKKGEFVAIMGLSGSGKTTLLNMLGCLDKPTDGKILIDEIDVSKMRDSQLFKIRRDKIGFVFQSFNLLPYLNARENVELAMESTKKSKKERSARARELLAMVGLVGRKEHRPKELSGGEQQRVAIARALANDPAVVLADELTGNLDHKTRNEIMKLLIDLNVNRGTTIVMVTHDKDIAWKTERILRLRNGRIEKEYIGNLAKLKKELIRKNANRESKRESVADQIAKVFEDDEEEEDYEEVESGAINGRY